VDTIISPSPLPKQFKGLSLRPLAERQEGQQVEETDDHQ